jgi:hypothetical protein
MKTHLNIVPVLLLLAGCGGADFTSGSSVEDTGGSAATGGATGVTGGVTAVTGGAGATGSTGGGAGGLGTGGEPMGTGGAISGTGGLGTGGAAAVCNPPTIAPEDLPQTLVWESYVSQIDAIPADLCLSCTHSPCATCDVAWWPVSQSADGLTLTATAAVICGPIDVSLVACGTDPSTSSCTTLPGAQFSTTLELSLQPKTDGSGYTSIYRTHANTTVSSYVGQNGACPQTAFNTAAQASQPMWDLWYELRDAVLATEWPCGS